MWWVWCVARAQACKMLRAASGSSDASINCDEFCHAMEVWAIGVRSTCEAFFKKVDRGGDGEVNYEELLAYIAKDTSGDAGALMDARKAELEAHKAQRKQQKLQRHENFMEKHVHETRKGMDVKES